MFSEIGARSVHCWQASRVHHIRSVPWNDALKVFAPSFPKFPENCKLFCALGRFEAHISDADARRLLKRQIAEIVMDGSAVVGVIRLSRKETVAAVMEVPGYQPPKRFHRKQDLGGSWVWQLLHVDGTPVA